MFLTSKTPALKLHLYNQKLGKVHMLILSVLPQFMTPELKVTTLAQKDATPAGLCGHKQNYLLVGPKFWGQIFYRVSHNT